MTDLAAWLLEQIDADEREARQVAVKAPAPWRVSEYSEIADANNKGIVTSGGYGSPWMQDYVDEHIARWDPARVLAESASKRRLITLAIEDAQHADQAIEGEWGGEHDLSGDLLRALAAPYADRPGYDEDWRP